jgi:Icc-related predicted phosphoesterase
MGGEMVRVAAAADLHYGKDSQGSHQALFEAASARADVLVLAGDLTDFGLPEEVRVLASDVRQFCRVPVLAVLGNHDFEAGRVDEVVAVLREAGVRVLDGDDCEVRGVGFAGVKGFGGGFGRGTLEPWGEAAIKGYVREAVDEVLKLEKALARLQTPSKVAVLHYAPVRDTVVGEPEEIFPFLGCGRLEEPLHRYEADVCFHGHAHRGAAEGRTGHGVPVYNVAVPVLKREQPTEVPLRVVELPAA